ncbi:MAG: RluA family pseudouridine synthase [Bacilli bacterium]|nr:RluA family pseudouridine synthase [Bacilli bacterium]
MEQFVVTEEYVGKRLDDTLTKAVGDVSRSKIQSMIKSGDVLVNGKKEKPAYNVRLADLITYKKTTNNQLNVVAEEIPLNIVFEDEDLIIINKPQGMVVHPGNGHPTGTLVNALVNYSEELAHKEGNEFRPGLVHRIDKDTSGLLAIVKNDKAYEALADQLSDHSMHREYIALVKGFIEESDGKIDAPIGRDPKIKTKMCVNLKNGKEAVTFFHVLKRYAGGYTLISCKLRTGRTHQIRVHMDYIGHPVIGDPMYGQGNRVIYDNGQLLHAYCLSFMHPTTKKEVSYEAPMPEHFVKVLDSLIEVE